MCAPNSAETLTCLVRRAETAERARLVKAGGTVEARLAGALVHVQLTARPVVSAATARRGTIALLAGAAMRARVLLAEAAALAARAL